MQAPCKDCPDRKLGCHSTCEKYIEFDKYRKKISEMRLLAIRNYEIVHYTKKRRKRW